MTLVLWISERLIHSQQRELLCFPSTRTQHLSLLFLTSSPITATSFPTSYIVAEREFVCESFGFRSTTRRFPRDSDNMIQLHHPIRLESLCVIGKRDSDTIQESTIRYCIWPIFQNETMATLLLLHNQSHGVPKFRHVATDVANASRRLYAGCMLNLVENGAKMGS